MIKTQIGDVEGKQCYTLEEVSQEVEMLLRDNRVAVIFKCANKHGAVDGSILVTTYPTRRIDSLGLLGEIQRMIAIVAIVVIEDLLSRLLDQPYMPKCPYCKSPQNVIKAGRGYTCMDCGHRVIEQPATKEE